MRVIAKYAKSLMQNWQDVGRFRAKMLFKSQFSFKILQKAGLLYTTVSLRSVEIFEIG